MDMAEDAIGMRGDQISDFLGVNEDQVGKKFRCARAIQRIKNWKSNATNESIRDFLKRPQYRIWVGE